MPSDDNQQSTFDRRTVVSGLAFAAMSAAWAGRAAASAATGFVRPDGARPIVTADPQATFYCPMRKAPVRWRALNTFNPAAAVHDGAVYLLFRAEDDSGAMEIGGHTSRIGLARSTDGIRFDVLPAPVIYPDLDDQRSAEWDGGCEDPRLAVAEDGRFLCTYTQYSRHAIRLGIASSRDMVFWTKHGSAFAGTRYADLMTKSGAIVHWLLGDRMVAARIGGHYWMIFGQGTLHAAHSEDLIRWTPVETAPGQLKAVMTPRPGHFDSTLVEAGPPPIWTPRGIVMLYNAKNGASGGDPARPPLEYGAGRAMLDPRDPTRLVGRSDAPFFAPELPWERSGQYTAGTTFIEGLVRYDGQWLLYYGSADSVVGVARSTSLAL